MIVLWDVTSDIPITLFNAIFTDSSNTAGNAVTSIYLFIRLFPS